MWPWALSRPWSGRRRCACGGYRRQAPLDGTDGFEPLVELIDATLRIAQQLRLPLDLYFRAASLQAADNESRRLLGAIGVCA